MSKPATNHCHVHLCRDKTHGRGVPEPVWGYSLADQGGDLLARRGGILFQLEADPEALRGFPYRFTKMGSSSRRSFLFKRAFSSSTVSDLHYRCLFGGYAQDRGALCSRQRFTVGDESIEAVQCRQAAVPCSDRGLANQFDVFQKRENLDCREIVHAEPGNRLRFLCGDEAQKQPPTVPIGQHGVMGNIALLHQPVVEEGV